LVASGQLPHSGVSTPQGLDQPCAPRPADAVPSLGGTGNAVRHPRPTGSRRSRLTMAVTLWGESPQRVTAWRGHSTRPLPVNGSANTMIPNPQWTDILQAIGTVGAFAVALYLLGVEVASRRRAREDQRRDQARHISAWVAEWPHLSVSTSETARELDPLAIRLKVHNGSEEPVHGCLVIICAPLHDQDKEVEFGPVHIIPPHNPHIYSLDLPGRPKYRPYVSDLFFRDSAGRRWHRGSYGKLVELPDRRESLKRLKAKDHEEPST